MDITTVSAFAGTILGFVSLVWIMNERTRTTLEKQMRYLSEQMSELKSDVAEQFGQVRTAMAEQFGQVRTDVAEQIGHVRAVQEQHTQQLADITRNVSELGTRVGRLEDIQLERAVS